MKALMVENQQKLFRLADEDWEREPGAKEQTPHPFGKEQHPANPAAARGSERPEAGGFLSCEHPPDKTVDRSFPSRYNKFRLSPPVPLNILRVVDGKTEMNDHDHEAEGSTPPRQFRAKPESPADCRGDHRGHHGR